MHVHQVCVVDDGGEHLAEVIDAMGLFDKSALAEEVAAVGVELERLAEDAQGAVVGVQGAVDDGRDETLGVVFAEGLLDDGLARAGLAT